MHVFFRSKPGYKRRRKSLHIEDNSTNSSETEHTNNSTSSATFTFRKLQKSDNSTTTANSIVSDEYGGNIAEKVRLSTSKPLTNTNNRTSSSLVTKEQREKIQAFLKNSTTSEFRIGKYVNRFKEKMGKNNNVSFLHQNSTLVFVLNPIM